MSANISDVYRTLKLVAAGGTSGDRFEVEHLSRSAICARIPAGQLVIDIALAGDQMLEGGEFAPSQFMDGSFDGARIVLARTPELDLVTLFLED